MKITAQQYAKSLYEAMKDKPQGEADVLLGNFVNILARNNQFGKQKEIIENFEKIYNQENGIVEAEVTSWEVLGDALRDKLSEILCDKYAAKKIVLREKTNKKIKGGIIVKVGDEILDASISQQLKKLNNILTK